jgi:hypothetical protein
VGANSSDDKDRDGLLDGIAVIGVARVDGFAAGKAFVLAVIEADAILAEAPTEVDFLAVDARRKIEQADFEVLHDAARGVNLFEGVADRLFEAVSLESERRRLIELHEQPARALDALGKLGELVIELAEFAARLDGLDQDRLDLHAQAFRFR